MKWLLIIAVAVLLIVLIAYIVMAVQSQKQPARLGLQQGQLLACPDSPNCVCSEVHSQASQQHAIGPITADDDTWAALKNIISSQGGMIQQDDGDYLHATFSSVIFAYIDDVELRRDAEHSVIHIRSASRVGRSDFGVNRKRVEALRKAL